MFRETAWEEMGLSTTLRASSWFRLVVQPDITMMYPYPDPKESAIFAMVMLKGYLMRFHAGLVGQMPPAVARFLIAHELYHVVLDATNTSIHLRGEEEENQVDELAEKAGFGSRTTLDRWSDGLRRTGPDSFAHLVHQLPKKTARELSNEFDGPILVEVEPLKP